MNQKTDEENALALKIAHNIRQERGHKGWTQQQLAKASNIRQPNLARLEKGRRVPTLRFLLKITKAMGIDLRDVL